MKIILLDELRGKGGEGDVIDVADGFANNYLFRQGIAIPATKGNLKQLEQRRKNIEKREVTRIANAEKLKEALEGVKVVIDVRVGEEGQLFGSVTNAMIAEALVAQLNVEIDRRRIELNNPIKVSGEHKVQVALYRDIKATLNLLVGVTEEEVAEEAAENEPEEVAAEDAAAEAAAEEDAATSEDAE
ncbi:50S ribosomal protein L9 [Eggerthellaceae bacterium zg-887]|uniref:50S ribosomal protein L9 n=1 Tax=Xiamenia xianingshaonis TaxID=2682776 RepID=UPI00140D6132|nr:50S ribosomal protein L9 [Xiamenia xianingshaonis]NHM16421.1 50S ribosomal protein L9 [Xiamenia xianingshaonis]